MGEQFVLTIKDCGRGIPADIIDKITQEGFSYGKAGLANGSGSGLGLYGVEKNLKDWGGSLKISSSLGKGTEIEMNFNPATA